MKPNELDALIEDCLEGRLSETDAAKLSARLEQSAEARARYWEAASIHGLLEQTMQGASLRVVTGQALPAIPRINRWLSWRPLMAAAAGIVLGIFCTSVVFAYVAPSLGKVITLLQESFESGPAPLVTGVPTEPGHWSGDYSEVVGEQQGVKPESGKKMLRFLRGDYEGKPNPEGSKIGDLYRLIDMRPYRQEFADGGAVVQLSAGFNTFEFPADERYECSLTLYALDAESVKNGSVHSGFMLNEAPLGSQKRRMRLDRSPATWQRLTSELRLPPDTDFLMVRICIQYAVKSAPRQTFAGHYVDDVRLTMARRNLLP
jgi:hypothetical protein